MSLAARSVLLVRIPRKTHQRPRPETFQTLEIRHRWFAGAHPDKDEPVIFAHVVIDRLTVYFEVIQQPRLLQNHGTFDQVLEVGVDTGTDGSVCGRPLARLDVWRTNNN